MPLTLAATDVNGNPGESEGKFTDRMSLGGRQIEGISNMCWKMICVDLAATAYEAGGVLIDPAITGLYDVRDMHVMAGPDPYAVATVAPPDGVTFLLNATDPRAPRLTMRDAGGEVGAGTTYAGRQVWLLLGGLR